ncbi:MAG TPA: glycosyltransferase family A protein [Terriglobales bacterium]|nr:glycosyltransferase family A protein [Terriglobales bacterium]
MISLVVCTIGRKSDLDRFLSSLDRQNCRDFEVLVVDQNDDDRVTELIQRHPGLAVVHLHSARGLSRARNVGLALASGDLIGIPDDDCWYPPDLIAGVCKWFRAHPEYGGLSVIKRDADGKLVGPRWPEGSCEITVSNVFDCAISSTIFLRRAVALRVGAFKENIGVGADTRYQSGEESDYLLRAMENGFRLFFDPSMIVRHPRLDSIDRLRQVTYPFALGFGYVLRSHSYSCLTFCRYFSRSVGGALLSLLKFDFANVHIYALRAAGQLRGYLLGPRDLRRTSRSAR